MTNTPFFTALRCVCALLWFAAAGSLAAQDWKGLRMWTDEMGREFPGRLRAADGKTVTIASEDGKDFVIPKMRLSRADRIFAYRFQSEETKRALVPYVRIEELTTADRALVPSLRLGDFGKVSPDAGAHAMANFLAWWDRMGVVPIPAPGERERGANKIYGKLADAIKAAPGALPIFSVGKGAEEFFKDEFSNRFAMRAEVKRLKSLSDLAEAPKGGLATLLAVNLRRGDSIEVKGEHYVSLIAFDEASGIIQFNTWGAKLTGTLTKVVLPNERAETAFFYLITLNTPPEEYADWAKTGKGFVIPGDHMDIVIAEVRMITPTAPGAAGTAATR